MFPTGNCRYRGPFSHWYLSRRLSRSACTLHYTAKALHSIISALLIILINVSTKLILQLSGTCSRILLILKASLSFQELRHSFMLWQLGMRVQWMRLISCFISIPFSKKGNPTSRLASCFTTKFEPHAAASASRVHHTFRFGTVPAENTARQDVWARWRRGLLPFLPWWSSAAPRALSSTSQGLCSFPHWFPRRGP